MRIRARLKMRQRVSPADVAWLQTYDATRGNDGNGTPGNKSHGRSAQKSRRVSYTEEETAAAAEGIGDAASIAAAAIATRAEGERLDSILKIGVNALKEAVDAYKSMAAALLEERQADAITHRSLLESIRTHFLERTEAEAELIRTQAENDAAAAAAENGESAIERLATEMLAKRVLAATDGPELTPGNSGRSRKG
jgi:hypothetical protein